MSCFNMMGKFGKSFYFVRHATSLWNEKNLCQGQRDINISPKGAQEAHNFAQSLQNIPLPLICSSPLIRAYHTAQIIQYYQPKCNIISIDALKERDWGELEGISSTKMYSIEKLEETNEHFIPGQGIENRQDFKQRIAFGLQQAFNHHSKPLIVSHGRWFLGLCEILHIPLLRQVPNLQLLEIHYSNSQWNIKKTPLI